jgi:hypothetical protein
VFAGCLDTWGLLGDEAADVAVMHGSSFLVEFSARTFSAQFHPRGIRDGVVLGEQIACAETICAGVADLLQGCQDGGSPSVSLSLSLSLTHTHVLGSVTRLTHGEPAPVCRNCAGTLTVAHVLLHCALYTQASRISHLHGPISGMLDVPCRVHNVLAFVTAIALATSV